MDATGPAPLGLRERKKQAMRAALSEIALRLAAERGVARVRVDDIAAEAGVSPRTFNNYFSSKEAAIVGVAADRARQFRDALRAAPADASLESALSGAILAVFPDEPDRSWVARTQLIRNDPALLAEEHRSDAEVERVLADEIGLRLGAGAGTLRPRLLAATLLAAVHAGLEFWLDHPDGASLRDTLADALRQLFAGAPS